MRRTTYQFKFDDKEVELCNSYKYLGLVINETLNFQAMSENMCCAANRALSSIITKMIKNSGFPLNVYSKLYDSAVCSVSDYGAEVIGFHESAALERLHMRALRAFLGLPRNTPSVGLRLEMNLLEPRSRTQIKMIRMYHRLTHMSDDRLTKRVFLWDLNLTESNKSISTWSREVKDILSRNNLVSSFSLNPFDIKLIVESLKNSLKQKDLGRLHAESLNAAKLRTYVHVSGNSTSKTYLGKPLSHIQRKYMAKLRLGILPLRLESGRYERPQLNASNRVCKQCLLGEVENEEHFMLKCPKHSFRRNLLFSSIKNLDIFTSMNNLDKLKFLLNDPDIVKSSSQFIIDSFHSRSV